MSNLVRKPPENLSLFHHVKNTWARLQENWENGYALDQELNVLSNYIESERVEIFDKKSKSKNYDWEDDYIDAVQYHESKLDFVNNMNKYIDEITKYWREYFTNLVDISNRVSIEALKAIIILNGAAMIAAITILSGEVAGASFEVKVAAKFILVFCFVSLVSVSVGYALMHRLALELSNEFKGRAFKPLNHKKLFNISEDMDRYIGIKGIVIDVLIYGSIVLFAIGLASSLSIVIFLT